MAETNNMTGKPYFNSKINHLILKLKCDTDYIPIHTILKCLTWDHVHNPLKHQLYI
jgi:hypothetical protein